MKKLAINNGQATVLGQSSLSKANLEVGYFQKQVCMEQRGHGSHFGAKFLFNAKICWKYSSFGQQLKSIGNTNKWLMDVSG